MAHSLAVYRPNDALATRSTFDLMPQALELAKQLSETEFVPKALQHRPAAIMACVLAGHEVGLPPMASLQHVHVIEGRPSIDAAAQRALVLAHGHEIWVEEQSSTRAVVCGRRKGEERILTVTWTLDDAKRAQLMSKQNWQRYPRQMLVARATGDVARGAFMDVLGGIAYNVEELSDGLLEGQVLEVIDDQPPSTAAAAEKTQRRRRAARAATAPAEPPAEPPSPDPEPEAPTGGVADEDHGSVVSGEPEPPEPEPEPLAQPLAGERAPGEPLSLAQQVAIVCNRIGIDRKNLLFAVTGKFHGREVTREQAIEVLEAAKAIERGEKRLDGAPLEGYRVVDVERAPADEATSAAEDEWS